MGDDWLGEEDGFYKIRRNLMALSAALVLLIVYSDEITKLSVLGNEITLNPRWYIAIVAVIWGYSFFRYIQAFGEAKDGRLDNTTSTFFENACSNLAYNKALAELEKRKVEMPAAQLTTRGGGHQKVPIGREYEYSYTPRPINTPDHSPNDPIPIKVTLSEHEMIELRRVARKEAHLSTTFTTDYYVPFGVAMLAAFAVLVLLLTRLLL